MEKYTKPKIEIMNIETEDVVLSSGIEKSDIYSDDVRKIFD